MKDLPLRTLNKETFLVPGATYERLSQLLELQDIYFGCKNKWINWYKARKNHFLQINSITGWPKSKLPFSKGFNSETKLFWPHVGKAKMRLRGGSFFLKNCKQTAEKCKQIFENWKKLPPLKPILALPMWGQICIL